MTNATRLSIGLATLAAAGIAAWFTGGSAAVPDRAITATAPPRVPATPAPEPAPPIRIVRAPLPQASTPVEVASAGTTVDPVRTAARDLLLRLEASVGAEYDLPDDLVREVLDFLVRDDAHREALLAEAWDPDLPADARGLLGLVIRGIADAELRAELFAAFLSHDPHASLDAELAELSADDVRLVTALTGSEDATVRVERLQRLDQASLGRPAVVAALRDLAVNDGDPAIRATALFNLGRTGVTGSGTLLLDAAVDPGRTPTERRYAAMALRRAPDVLSADDLLDALDRADPDTRAMLLGRLGDLPADRAVDDILIAAVVETDAPAAQRGMAADSLRTRLMQLDADGARDLGEQIATTLRRMPQEDALAALDVLSFGVIENLPLRELLREWVRDDADGGPVHAAVASNVALQRAVGAL